MSNAPPQPTHSSSDSTTTSESSTFPGKQAQPQVNDLLRRYVDLVPPVLPSASMTEKFLLTAADPAAGTRVERLERVIQTKYEAGLLKPYNYAKGYARLSRWIDCKYVDPLFQKGVHRRFAPVAYRESQSSRSCNLYQSYDPSST
jgi:hypothetical protein